MSKYNILKIFTIFQLLSLKKNMLFLYIIAVIEVEVFY